MGYEHFLEGCIRSSVELRRIRNAKITAARHRLYVSSKPEFWKHQNWMMRLLLSTAAIFPKLLKWQEVRLQREQEEKKKFEEILNHRKRERARLASYIYSSAQNAVKVLFGKSQGNVRHVTEENMFARDTRNGNAEETEGTQKTSRSKVVDVAGLSNLSVSNKPSNLQLRNASMDESEDATKFLEEALQERLQNEEATSLLIDEITDMKSRLDDCLAKPVINLMDTQVRVGNGFKVPPDSGGVNIPKQHIYEHQGSQLCKVDNMNIKLEKEEVKKVDHGTSYISTGTKNDGSVLKSMVINSDNKENGQDGNAERRACKNVNNYSSDEITKEQTLSNNILQDAHIQRCNDSVFSQLRPEHNLETFSTDRDPDCVSIKRNARSDQVLSCSNKSSNILALDLGQACKTYAKLQLHSNQYSKKPVLCPTKTKKADIKVSAFTDEEKSILASLKRLDVKLAYISSKMSNSSRTSLMSEELKSTKSAPAIMKNKSGSDSYSINNGMLPTRPMTAHKRGILPTSKRRYAVGLTNMVKERNNQCPPTITRKLKTSEVLASDNQNDRRQKSDGTIVLHQNAEFLFK